VQHAAKRRAQMVGSQNPKKGKPHAQVPFIDKTLFETESHERIAR
jgi:hypothetical protein